MVIDPFMGVGGTSLAAAKLGCPFIGIDRDSACVKYAEELFDKLSKTPVCHKQSSYYVHLLIMIISACT
jgi:DNA modification methylase